MDEKIKKKWLKALRSGEYEQYRNQLCRTDKELDSFCCLGVLCDVYARETKGKYWETKALDYGTCFEGDMYFEGQADTLNDSQRKRFGLSEKDENILVEMNDKGKLFPEIADYIEKNL